jgi:hypothetical protein
MLITQFGELPMTPTEENTLAIQYGFDTQPAEDRSDGGSQFLRMNSKTEMVCVHFEDNVWVRFDDRAGYRYFKSLEGALKSDNAPRPDDTTLIFD